MDLEVMNAYLPRFWDALLLTLRIGWQGVALALVLGVACAVAVHWKIPVLRQIVGGYIELFRNTPLLVQLFFYTLRCPKSASASLRRSAASWDWVFWAVRIWQRPSAAGWKTSLLFRRKAPRA